MRLRLRIIIIIIIIIIKILRASSLGGCLLQSVCFFYDLILVFVARYMGPEGPWQPLSGCHYPILPKVLHMHLVVPLYEAVLYKEK